MKKRLNIFSLLTLFAILFSGSLQAQQQAIEIPSDGKVNVYVANGATRKFDVFDGEKFVTAIKAGKYFLYKCEPGEHLFWVGDTPTNYLKATFDANSSYVIGLEAPDSALLLGVVGALTAGAKMLVFNSKEFKDQKLFYQVVKHFKKVDFMASSSVENREDLVKKAMEKFSKFKTEKEDRILILTSDMRFINADKPIKQ